MQNFITNISILIAFFCSTSAITSDDKRAKIFEIAIKEAERLAVEEDQFLSRNLALRVATYIVYLGEGREMNKDFEKLFINVQLACHRNGHAQVDMLISPKARQREKLSKWLDRQLGEGGVTVYRDISLLDLIADVYETMDHTDYEPKDFRPCRYDLLDMSNYFSKLTKPK